MGFFSKISNGLAKSRNKFKEQMNRLLNRGPDLDEGFWEELEETLILSDLGPAASMRIVENLREQATRKALPDAWAVLDLLSDEIVSAFATGGDEIFGGRGSVVLFVGINGTGKTTTVGKIAKEATDGGRNVILGSADTFRAAAIEQLQVWADRAGVEMVTRERGSDPASVCYETIERAEQTGAELVLIDTAGRLHTSDDLMRELEKVANVVRKRSNMPVYTVLVIDATTGQNGMQQAREFDKVLDLDGLIVTKLDGTAKGGIAVAISHELGLPILKIGVGEKIDDLRDFDARDYVSAFIGDFEEGELEDGEGGSGIDVVHEGGLEDFAEGEEGFGGADVEDGYLEDEGIDGGDFDEELEEEPDFEEGAGGEDAEDALEEDELEEELDEELEEEREEPKRKKHFWDRWF